MGDAEACGKPVAGAEEVAPDQQSSPSVAGVDPEEPRGTEERSNDSIFVPESQLEKDAETSVDKSDDVRDEENNENAASQELLDVPDKDQEEVSLRSVSDGDNSVFSDNPDCSNNQQQQSAPEANKNPESENESEELDDIELIFTTDETCRDVGLQEDLVSITENESWQNNGGGQGINSKYRKSVEGEASVCNGDKTSSVEEAASSQSSSIDREESVDRFDESSSTRLNKMWSQCSVLVETDISKCGVVEEPDQSARHAARRNTLAAPPTAYR